ncbi:hypothetical protein SISSUDRAFT_1067066 [Sistotremastrum suecicum HHB10207 ss-3]|uniref:Uncharacterized protein n=1 Tax=Sistotremastrum suecicum HHB10207 ss-3 TaxID=1314776 RepID=A0A165XK10_9AGAM|nr:hypothetical protein SISSUDRAFT_1067066 [Sistotremastrum suecicum HHB10207 ss-3]
MNFGTKLASDVLLLPASQAFFHNQGKPHSSPQSATNLDCLQSYGNRTAVRLDATYDALRFAIVNKIREPFEPLVEGSQFLMFAMFVSIRVSSCDY